MDIFRLKAYPTHCMDLFYFIYFNVFSNEQLPHIVSRPGQSQRLLYKQPCDSLIKSVSHFLPQLYGAAMPKWLNIALPVIK